MVSEIENERLVSALDDYQAALAIEGDQRAFELLYTRWHPRLLKFALRQTKETEAARDVMQNAAMTIAKDIHRLSDPSRFGAWAYTIVRRRAADYVHAIVRERQMKSELEHAPAQAEFAGQEDALSLKNALKNLPEADRVLLSLFYVDGMRISEISAGLGIPVGTVKSRLFTAREKLKTIYDAP